MRSVNWVVMWSVLGMVILSCKDGPGLDEPDAGSSDTGSAGADICPIGSEACPCTQGGACNAGLTCLSQVCVDLESDSMPTSATDTGSHAGSDLQPSTTQEDEKSATDSGNDDTGEDQETGVVNETGGTDESGSNDIDTGEEEETESGSLPQTDEPPGSDTSVNLETDTLAATGSSIATDTHVDVSSDSQADVPTDTQVATDTGSSTGVCTADDKRCSGDDVQTCNAEGTEWELSASCTSDTVCNDEVLECVDIALSPSDGWVDRFSNGLGLQGAWFVFGDYFDSPDLDEVWLEETDGSMCMSGTASSSTSTRPTGAFQVCHTDAEQDPAEELFGLGQCPFGKLDDIVGFSVTITGDDIPFGLRVMFAEPGREQNAFVEVGSGTTDVYFDVAENLSGTGIYSVDRVEMVHFQVPNDEDFDFCISEVTPLR